mmetsp:Transcript_22257/g.65942  ORF Transcript_22257/g.65942 Transcript_22257/m.65942 type:complete len:253 (-) Transcript_22257:1607-2365(-)
MTAEPNPASKVQFRVAEVSSTDPDHPASELEAYREDGTGWWSAKSCSFPQEIVIQLLPYTAKCIVINQIQILAHEANIPQKIEIVLASCGGNTDKQPTTFQECANVRRLGYVSLDSNESSNHQARELKSIKVGEEEAAFVKLILHRCHSNQRNGHNQVSIIGVTILGKIVCHDHQEFDEDDSRRKDEISICDKSNTTEIRADRNREHPTQVVQQPADSNNGSNAQLEPNIQCRLNILERAKQKKAELEVRYE